jgi:hypothetical protein
MEEELTNSGGNRERMTCPVWRLSAFFSAKNVHLNGPTVMLIHTREILFLLIGDEGCALMSLFQVCPYLF